MITLKGCDHPTRRDEACLAPARLRLTVRGAVQGVGFRPFVYRLAAEMGLAGWVNNGPQGVCIEVEGPSDRLRTFLLRLDSEKPPLARIQGMEPSFLDPIGYSGFEIRASDASGAKTALVLPDIAPCPDCLREMFHPADRRYRYPFTNCTNCGPRFTIIESLPYDRPGTTMRRFVMCPRCRAEYEDPGDRRFHAQPNACPDCGPQLALWDRDGIPLAAGDRALRLAGEAVRSGAIVALKGVGGFHLIADARSEETVQLLRRRKNREEKPFALMFPSAASLAPVFEVSDLEARLLRSPECPIVLLRRKSETAPGDESPGYSPTIHRPAMNHRAIPPSPLAFSVAPGNPCLGVMLPPTPLHHLLMADLGFPVVATSGNLSDEPICTDEREALGRLRGLADLFLVHDRPIARHVDDSVVRVIMDRELVLRRSRGYAPLPVGLARSEGDPPLLSVGAHQKNTVALSVGRGAFLSQHVGDLDTAQAMEAFRSVIAGFLRMFDVRPAAVACDLHPDYASAQYALASGLPAIPVQHHFAHVLSCTAENEIEGPVLGVAWDGTGYGSDGTLWGGEFLRVSRGGFERVGHLRTFRLPGGDLAVRQPRRAALGVLYEMFGDDVFIGATVRSPLQTLFSPVELSVLKAALQRSLNAPITSSAGRLFDAVSALAGIRRDEGFEGQAAMELEFALHGVETDESYPFQISANVDTLSSRFKVQGSRPHFNGVSPEPSTLNLESALVVDWGLLLESVLDDVGRGVPIGRISARFHNALVEIIVAVAQRVCEPRVVLTGGCFQNRYLTERAVRRLREAGFQPYWHQRIPPNDGGIAVGQAVAAAACLNRPLTGHAGPPTHP